MSLSFFVLKLKEFYWSTTRLMGLGHLHGREKEPWQKLVYYSSEGGQAAVARILVLARVRFIEPPIHVIEHIGHVAMDFDCYLKDQVLSGRKVIPVLLLTMGEPANEALLKYWSKYMMIIRNRKILQRIQPFAAHFGLIDSVMDYCSVMRGPSRAFYVQSNWKGRPPLLSMSAKEIARGEAELRALGLPEGAWFVCVHSREGGHLPKDEWLASYRNTNIADYLEAMRAIIARGGWCIRVGDPSMSPLEPMPGIIDYAHSSSKSEWMDLFLCARCRFLLGNSSGLYGVAGIFGKPSALANVAPLGCVYSQFPSDISIPKLLVGADGRVMSFPQAFADEASEYRFNPEFAARNLQQLDNSPEEIAELAIEMMDRLDGCFAPEPDDISLQAGFRSLIQPRHYSWWASSQVGQAFLRRHSDLLTDPSETKRHNFGSTQ